MPKKEYPSSRIVSLESHTSTYICHTLEMLWYDVGSKQGIIVEYSDGVHFINLHRGFFMLILWGVVSNCHCHCHDWWLGCFARHAKHAALRIQEQSYWKAISTKVRVDAILLYSTGIAVAWLVEFLLWWSSTCVIGWCELEWIYCDLVYVRLHGQWNVSMGTYVSMFLILDLYEGLSVWRLFRSEAMPIFDWMPQTTNCSTVWSSMNFCNVQYWSLLYVVFFWKSSLSYPHTFISSQICRKVSFLNVLQWE